MTIPYNSTKYTNIFNMKEEFDQLKQNKEILYIHKKEPKIIFKEIDFQIICDTLYISFIISNINILA